MAKLDRLDTGHLQAALAETTAAKSAKRLEQALADEQRPGRPPKLSAEQRAEVAAWLAEPPGDAEEWTARRLQPRIAETFEYSTAHVHRRFLS